MDKAIFVSLSSLIVLWTDIKKLLIGLIVLMIIHLRFKIKVYCKENGKKFSLLKIRTWNNIPNKSSMDFIGLFKDYIFVIIGFWIIENRMLKDTFSIIGYSGTDVVMIVLGCIELIGISDCFKKLRGYNIYELVTRILFSKNFKDSVNTINPTNQDNANS